MRETIERLTDLGKVYEGGILLGEYTYYIVVIQRMSTFRGEQIPRLKSLKGRIYMNLDEIHRLISRKQKQLTLYLEDGRKLDFSFATNYGTISAKSNFY